MGSYEAPRNKNRKLTVIHAVNGAPWRRLWDWLLDPDHISGNAAPERRIEGALPEHLEDDPE